MSRESETLAIQARDDPEAFVALYDRYYARVYSYIRYRCDDGYITEDLTAQVFERLLNVIGRYDPKRAPLEAWLFAIVRNIVTDSLRKERFRLHLPWEALQHHSADDPFPEETAIQNDVRNQLSKSLRTLKDSERDLLGLKYNTGLNNRQIAELTGLSEQNVGVILFRSIKQLRKLMDDPYMKISSSCIEKKVEHE
ncbi:MAG: sigma-70 family RNA polymerase sigma factor [Anaerolineaceae bacterium]|nr:sigma-70 family RNA polymerase sigma factor [Anaerolineaceae bacterium]